MRMLSRRAWRFSAHSAACRRGKFFDMDAQMPQKLAEIMVVLKRLNGEEINSIAVIVAALAEKKRG